VRCEWSTASEINNDYFTIERSTEGIHFDSLLSVKGAGNSTTRLFYSADDDHPLNGNSYYRLKQTNYDGSFSYSDAVFVYRNSTHDAYTIFPNPSDGENIFIVRNGSALSGSKVVVRDMLGKEVAAVTRLSEDKKQLQVSIDPSSYFTNDYYLVSVSAGPENFYEKVMIRKK